MNKRRLDAGELFGIILLLSIAIDLIACLWFKSDLLRINFLWSGGWISILLITIGAIMFVLGCIGGYISHEAFNTAVAPAGDIHHILDTGLFKLVRHPFYVSLILITLSFVLMLRSYMLLAGLVVIIVILVGDARKEEIKMLEKFGDEYKRYQQEIGMFFPRVVGK
jgi:protein-S-isoprenylcysteine O-methyltransferase Ste14